MPIGFGVGLTTNMWPYSTGFLDRLYKKAAVNSQSAFWQEVGSRYGFRRLDVEVEYWPGGESPFPTSIERRSSVTMLVRVIRPHLHLDKGTDVDDFGDREAETVFAEILGLLAAERSSGQA